MIRVAAVLFILPAKPPGLTLSNQDAIGIEDRNRARLVSKPLMVEQPFGDDDLV